MTAIPRIAATAIAARLIKTFAQQAPGVGSASDSSQNAVLMTLAVDVIRNVVIAVMMDAAIPSDRVIGDRVIGDIVGWHCVQ